MAMEGRITLIGGDTDVLHCGYKQSLSEGGKRYPSADHYAHSMILASLGLDEVLLLELLATSSSDVSKKARELLRENMPSGLDINSLSEYLSKSRQSYTMQGLRLRAEQDKKFREALAETKNSLLIVCDRRDNELGIGMDEEMYMDFMHRHNADYNVVSKWMHNAPERPPELGQNQLGFFLMWLRYEMKEKETAKWQNNSEIEMDGINLNSDGAKMKIAASNLVIAFEGIFRPLSNYYAMPLEMKEDVYRSVEHYAYQRLFESLKMDETDIMKLRTTSKATDLCNVANKIVKKSTIDYADYLHKKSKMDRWRQSAIKHKFSRNEFLQQLLLSTGFAILLEYTNADDHLWVSNVDEFELQHLLTKRYITPNDIVDWMCERSDPPKSLNHLVGNRSGIFLMEIRRKFSVGNTHRIPLVSPLTSNVIRTAVSNHMICFTPESVLHPLYPAEIFVEAENKRFRSPVHYVVYKTSKFFEFDAETEEFLLSADDTLECWSNLHFLLNDRNLSLDKIQRWFIEERQSFLKAAMRFQMEQHPPLLRVLLDTEDALLVCCGRFSSSEAELNVGMRERDVRLWCSQVRLSTKQLMDLFLRPMAFRPAYVGGNRIGLILMELRREFILKGVFPHQLPELPMAADCVLGSESPLENYVPHVNFQIFDDTNFLALWANPLILMTKLESPDSELDTIARSVKSKPPLIAMMDKGVDDIIYAQNDLKRSAFHEKMFDEQNVELMRGAYAKYVHMIRAGILRDLRSQRILNFWARHTSNVQNHRRLVETRNQSQPNIIIPPPRINPWANNQGPVLDSVQQPEPLDPNRIPIPYGQHLEMKEQMPPPGMPPPVLMNEQKRMAEEQFRMNRREHHDREWADRRRRDRGFRNRDNSPGDRRRHDRRRNVQNQLEPRNANPVVAAKPPAPPQPKKPKRVVNEEDLSEGEIVSSDEDE